MIGRLQKLTEEVHAMPEARNIPLIKEQPRGALQTPPRNNLEGYKAPLIARVHLRLGMWRWTITPAEVCSAINMQNPD